MAEALGNFQLTELTELLTRLDVEHGECCTLSIAASLINSTNSAELMFGSAIIGPVELANLSWAGWMARTNRSTARIVADWQATGLQIDKWKTFTEARDGWLFHRFAIYSPDLLRKMAEWISALFAGDVEIPITEDHRIRLTTSCTSPLAMVRTFPYLNSPASALVQAVGRPTLGFLFRRNGRPITTPLPSEWELNGTPVSQPAYWLLGVSPESTDIDKPAEGIGLYVGRLETRAWLTEIRGNPGFITFDVGIGLDMSRVSLADLELSLEEYLRGDLVSARRIRLGDIELPAAAPSVSIRLPTLGSGLQRRVRLFDRDGVLVDATNRLSMVEQIQASFSLLDTSETTTVTVGSIQNLDLVQRLQRADEAENQFTTLLERGLANRIIDDPTTGLLRLQANLQYAIGHLDILDPYFGHAPADWMVLDQVSVHVRVLTNHGGNLTHPPAGTAARALSLNVRKWQNGKTAWHDRVYLWSGGGLTVGTSPSGLGKRVARLDRMGGTEATGWQQLFDSWWAGPEVVVL